MITYGHVAALPKLRAPGNVQDGEVVVLPRQASSSECASFLAGGGDMGELMRSHHWPTSPLGDSSEWPESLRAIVGLMINSRYPMFVAWGPELSFLYNDGYAPILGGRHPNALGRPFRQVWPEIWSDINPLIVRALAGEPTFSENLHLVMERNGFPEDTWYSFSYSPVRDEGGAVAGMFCACTETTQAVLNERRREALLELDVRLHDVADTADLSFTASQILGRALRAVRVGYGAVDADAGTITIERNWFAPGFDDLAGVHAFADYGSYVDELRRGEAVANGDVEVDPRTTAAAAAFRSLGVRAHLDVPVLEQGRVVGQIFVHSATPRIWTDEEVTFVREIAERTRAAIARRLAEQDLHASEERYRSLFETMDDGFCLIAFIDGPHGPLSDYVHVEANRAYALNAGIPDIVGRRLREVVLEEEADSWVDRFRTVLDSGEPVHFEQRLAATGRHLELSAFRTGSAEQPQVAIIFKDVTARRNAEDALRELNATLETQVAARSAERDRLWRLSQDMLARADYSGMMSAVSPAWTQVLGWSEAELLSRGYASFMHAEDMPATLKAIAGMAETGRPTRFENRIATADGGFKHIEWTVAPEPDGVNFIAVGRDLSLTKAREAELEIAREALRQSQKMEAMGQLTGGVAHDFNNLLTPIVGSLDMLHRKGVGSEREQRLISGAMQSADRAKTLVQRLLAFARRQPLQPVPVDLGKLIRGMGGLVESTTGPQIKVVVDAPDDLPAANADPNQLEMALLNLSVNARDAMPEGGVLRITAGVERVGPGHRSKVVSGEYVRLSVADTGVGMDDATLARAVEPFFSTKGIGRGTGLGLSMAHGLASQLGGALTIQSLHGLGTNVELWLPVSAGLPVEANITTVVEAAPTLKGTALLVDDEELVRISTADMLLELGYSVVEAASGNEALDRLGSGERFDLLVTDHLMPGMTGTELARAVQAITPRLPVLLVSGYAELEGVEPDLLRLAKPFRKHELGSILTQLSARESLDTTAPADHSGPT